MPKTLLVTAWRRDPDDDSISHRLGSAVLIWEEEAPILKDDDRLALFNDETSYEMKVQDVTY